jgi:hypothetical protein
MAPSVGKGETYGQIRARALFHLPAAKRLRDSQSHARARNVIASDAKQSPDEATLKCINSRNTRLIRFCVGHFN